MINEQFERRQELSPLIPKDIISTFKKTYKNSTIERPPEINGLEEIKIYCKSEEGDIELPSMENVVLQVGDLNL